MNELTGMKSFICKHCHKCFSDSSALERHEQIHTGVKKPYKWKHFKKSPSRSSIWKAREERHATNSPSKGEQHNQYYQPTRHLQDPATSHGGENSSQVERLTCWICQEEFSDETCLIQHYDDHMIYRDIGI